MPVVSQHHTAITRWQNNMKLLLFMCALAVTFAVILGESSKCLQPVEVGRCYGAMQRYAYSREEGCKLFVYGGCGGNDNNFPSYEECQRACLVPR